MKELKILLQFVDDAEQAKLAEIIQAAMERTNPATPERVILARLWEIVTKD